MTDASDSFDSLVAQASAKLDARDYELGAALLEKALSIRGTPSLWQLLGTAWRQCGEMAKARNAFLKVVELKPENPRAWVSLAATELDLELFSEAIAHYQRAVDQDADRAELHIWLANAHDRAGDLANALECYRRAEALEPDNAEIFYERALAYRNQGHFVEAARDFRRAYELDPSREHAPELAREMAIARYRSSHAAAAPDENDSTGLEYWQRAVMQQPNNAIYWNNLGYTRWQQGDLQAAVFDFERAIELQADYIQARVNYSAVLKKLGRTHEAELAQRKIVDIDPGFAHGHYNLAATLFESNRFTDALTSIDATIAIDKTDADYFVLRGSILEGLERKPEALAEFTRAIGIDGNNARAYFMRGNMQFDLGRLQTAVADYTRALEIAPNVAETHLNLGLCDLALDRKSEARAHLERALQLKEDLGIAHLRLGQIARNEDRAIEAENHLAKARSLGFTEETWT